MVFAMQFAVHDAPAGSSSGLSTGQKAGIGAGVGVAGVLLLAGLVTFILQLRKKRILTEQKAGSPNSNTLEATNTPGTGPQLVAELQDSGPVGELAGNPVLTDENLRSARRYSELP
jgi:hypothetical protein